MTTDAPVPPPVTQRPGQASAFEETRPAPIGRESVNLPNTVTVTRLLLACVLFGMIAYDGLWKSAAALFVFAAATDFLDGWLARRYGQVTTLGRILDPFVDKIVVVGALLFLLEKRVRMPGPGEGEELIVWSGVSAWMVLVIVGREMFVSSLRGFLEKHGIDFSADWTGKVKTTVQFVAVTASLLSLAPEFGSLPPQIDGRSWFLWTRDALLWGAALFTAYSGVTYIARGMRELKR
ncbi:CDP-alcohol phosphatidyltransferase family protein [Alienimonas californiensis]|uniref:CDP-diacylglycerol--glycerol-3-phosphate 3-phosphatidyltransferase n=1 Tax=Alienimonas californiensis TaxID=2527989 RepID=A0A517P8D8_9PLAN|nr:CDP-alcohol phosphatidyltransferase family protein [Alienimonas californiensis]QDT15637.1 CDP-diacylglycerol--glycerol-3-phosphate 3-phosphatidyltransferase [Alienimonas californiensis]